MEAERLRIKSSGPRRSTEEVIVHYLRGTEKALVIRQSEGVAKANVVPRKSLEVMSTIEHVDLPQELFQTAMRAVAANDELNELCRRERLFAPLARV